MKIDIFKPVFIVCFILLLFYIPMVQCKNNAKDQPSNVENGKQVLDGRSANVKEDLSSVIISYTEALGDKIEIKNRIMYYSRQTGFYGDMEGPSANFAPTRTTTEQKLNDQEIIALLDVFMANNWSDLKENYGANPEDRNYPETLQLWDRWGNKTVVYRSNPNVKDNPKPKEFDIIVKAIIALKDKYFKKEGE